MNHLTDLPPGLQRVPELDRDYGRLHAYRNRQNEFRWFHRDTDEEEAGNETTWAWVMEWRMNRLEEAIGRQNL